MIDDLPQFGSALVVVAHPDDETLWCGGLMLRHPELDWTVLSLCRGSDPDRRPKFSAACAVLNADPIILDVNDDSDLPPLELEEDVIHPIDHALGNRSWDLCVTHGRNGEYGHQRHRDVHKGVLEMVRRDQLACNRLWTFAYERNPAGLMLRSGEANVVFSLNHSLTLKKQEIIRDVYGFAEDSFEFGACLGEEGFHNIR